LRAYIVVDLGFGDAGKGLLTDFLVRQYDAGLVVRYNGGAQAGHNVVTPDGRHHTFSQFGSGTFIPHVRTYLSRHVVVHPTALLVEGDLLAGKGVRDPFSRLRLSDQAVVITPYHQAANRIRETLRGSDRHGSCGVGVGEAFEDAIMHPDISIVAGDLYQPLSLRKKLRAIRERKREQLVDLIKNTPSENYPAREWQIFEMEEIADKWMVSISRICELGLIVSDQVLEDWIHETENVVFEGAQGVLLDADAGFHPYTTWSDCTGLHASEIIQEMFPEADIYRIGVMRSHAIRHGPGPLPTETDELTPGITEDNQYNPWQGPVRYGWFDAVLARYALGATGGVDALAVTHMDGLSQLKAWKYCPGYGRYHDLFQIAPNSTIAGSKLTNFIPPDRPSLLLREQITQGLFEVVPDFETCEAEAGKVIQAIETLTGQSVGMVSHGPCSRDVEILNSIRS
jgi:adenylosuccinate synthase